MPEMNGIDVTRAIRKSIGEDVLIIIISAYDWSDIEQEARQAGANAFISKPLFKSRLAHLFNSLVGNEEELPETMPLQNFEDMNLAGHRALLVEDNELNAEIATEILEMTGITVDTANDGSTAIDMIRERQDIKYDIIFMDIQMPIMNGYDAARAIRNLGCDYCKSVPIIAMTANAFAEDVQSAFSAGMNEHIAKPLDLKALAAVLDKWVLANGGEGRKPL
jgi:CheY-like chemotaxis protein